MREITDKPFGVDLLIPGDIPEDLSAREVPPFPEFLEDLMPKVEGLKGNPPPPLTIELARAQVEVTLEEKVPLMVSALGTPPAPAATPGPPAPRAPGLDRLAH